LTSRIRRAMLWGHRRQWAHITPCGELASSTLTSFVLGCVPGTITPRPSPPPRRSIILEVGDMRRANRGTGNPVISVSEHVSFQSFRIVGRR
jgi:hypothetical protein